MRCWTLQVWLQIEPALRGWGGGAYNGGGQGGERRWKEGSRGEDGNQEARPRKWRKEFCWLYFSKSLNWLGCAGVLQAGPHLYLLLRCRRYVFEDSSWWGGTDSVFLVQSKCPLPSAQTSCCGLTQTSTLTGQSTGGGGGGGGGGSQRV